MKNTSTNKDTVIPPHRSSCADRAHRVEFEKLRSLSVGDRIRLALTMRERFAWLQPAPAKPLHS